MKIKERLRQALIRKEKQETKKRKNLNVLYQDNNPVLL
jgi:hypothetical protein